MEFVRKKVIISDKIKIILSMAQILSQEIRNRIRQRGKGNLYAVSDFADLNNDSTVTRVLSRLEKENVLLRLSQGIYLYPSYNRYGVHKPSIDEIAITIAEKDKARIIPSGLTALNILGLSTQVPMNAVYLTNGTPREITVGNRKITFKKSAPRNFAYKSELFSLVVSAMKEIGEKNINDNFFSKIKEILAKENQEIIERDFLIAPQWIRKKLNGLWVLKQE
jgi:predicted transcriptional regulator of viral defense system